MTNEEFLQHIAFMECHVGIRVYEHAKKLVEAAETARSLLSSTSREESDNNVDILNEQILSLEE